MIFNSQTIKVKPSHPDKSGGLGTIGRFAANLAYLFAVFGILVSVSLLSNTLTQGIASNQLFYLTKVGGLIVYIIAAPLLFFVPLISSHLAMLAFRDSFLFDLGKEIDDEYAKIQEMRSKLNAGELDEITKRINYFRELYSQAKEFPVWPFNAQNLGKFFGFVSGAVLPGIVSVVSKFFGF